MRVERYSEKYLPDVVKLIENFHQEAISEYDQEIDPQALIETIKTADHKNAFLLIVNETCQGILYGMAQRSHVNGKTIFQEIMWYVNREYRGRGVWLLNEVERLLKLDGVCIMIMAVLENSKTAKLKRLYESIGYKAMETHYVRTL